MDLLAGFDMAITDGVDVISVLIGGYPRKFFKDLMATGAFDARKMVYSLLAQEKMRVHTTFHGTNHSTLYNNCGCIKYRLTVCSYC